MKPNDDKVLRDFFKEEFRNETLPETFEDDLMKKVEGVRLKAKPLVSSSFRIFVIAMAILLPLTFIFLKNYITPGTYDPGFDLQGTVQSIYSSPLLPMTGVLFCLICANILWREMRNKTKRVN